eukprot:3079400-Heterocapsa_arctica.AAC.1
MGWIPPKCNKSLRTSAPKTIVVDIISRGICPTSSDLVMIHRDEHRDALSKHFSRLASPPLCKAPLCSKEW